MNTHDTLLVAELSEATVALLALLNRARRSEPATKALLERLFAEAGYEEARIGSLLNQGTMLGHAYLTLVWLWEKRPGHFADVIPDRPLDDPPLEWPRPLDATVLEWEVGLSRVTPRTIHAWLRHLRNALSHGRVTFDDDGGPGFIFADALPGSPTAHTRIRLLPDQLGNVATAVLQACQQGFR